jgi:ABC-type tungstate transport system permease subunit
MINPNSPGCSIGSSALGQKFIDWLISSEGQDAIAGYKINGQKLFYPNATDPNARYCPTFKG